MSKLIDLVMPITNNKCKHCLTGWQNSDGWALIRCDCMEEEPDMPSGFFQFIIPHVEICTLDDWAKCPLNK